MLQPYRQVKQAIAAFCLQYNRLPQEVELIAVSKRHAVDKIIQLNQVGQRHFAENYLQEAEQKIAHINALQAGRLQASPDDKIVWHFIGAIQSRKCRQIAQLFDWVQTVASEKVAHKLNQYRQGYPPLNTLIQLNLEHESSKAGIGPGQLEDLCQVVRDCANLRLAGLMIIPRPEADRQRQRRVFADCRALLERLVERGFDASQLSMGMSNDLEAAIAEGATQVRIGTALFGARPS